MNHSVVGNVKVVAQHGTKLFLVIAIILFFIFNPLFQSIPSDSKYYVQGIEENSLQFYDEPLLFFTGNLLSPETLYIPVFIFFFGTLFVLWRLFKELKLNVNYIFLFLLLQPQAMTFLWTFHRDALLFFLAAWHFYYCYKFYETKSIKFGIPAFITAVLAMLTKQIGMVLMGNFVLVILALVVGRYVYFSLLPSIENWQNNLSIYSFAAYLINPLFVVGIILLQNAKKFVFTNWIIITYLTTFMLAVQGYDLMHIWRYSYFLVAGMIPIAAFQLKESKGKLKAFAWFVLILFLLAENYNFLSRVIGSF